MSKYTVTTRVTKKLFYVIVSQNLLHCFEENTLPQKIITRFFPILITLAKNLVNLRAKNLANLRAKNLANLKAKNLANLRAKNPVFNNHTHTHTQTHKEYGIFGSQVEC